MAKKKTNTRKEKFAAFKVSEGRAKKAKNNQSNINFKKVCFFVYNSVINSIL